MMISKEEIESVLKESKESDSFEPLREMVINLRKKGVSNEYILKDLRTYFCKYNNAEDKDYNVLDKAYKSADLMDEIDYNRF